MNLLLFRCCQTDRPNLSVPHACFDANGCPGLHFLGLQACSTRMLNAVAVKLQNTMVEVFREAQIRQQNQLR